MLLDNYLNQGDKNLLNQQEIYRMIKALEVNILEKYNLADFAIILKNNDTGVLENLLTRSACTPGQEKIDIFKSLTFLNWLRSIYTAVERYKSNWYVNLEKTQDSDASIRYLKQVGYTQISALPVISKNHVCGLLVLMSAESKFQENLSKKNIDPIITDINSIISAVNANRANIEVLRPKDFFKNNLEKLYAFSSKIRKFDDMDKFLQKIPEIINDVLDYSEISIWSYNRKNSTMHEVCFACSKKGYKAFENESSEGKYKINPEFLENLFAEDGPIVINYGAEINMISFLDGGDISPAIERYNVAFAKLFFHDRPLGYLAISLDRDFEWDSAKLQLIRKISEELASSLSQIKDRQKIKRLEWEKTKLLALGNEIATIRNKDELTRIFSSKFREFSPLVDYCLHWINESEGYHFPYLWDAEIMRSESADEKKLSQGKYLLNDGILNIVAKTGKMLVIDLDKENARTDCPAYLKILKRKSITKILAFPVYIGRKLTGVFFANYNQMLEIKEEIIICLCAQLAVGVSHLIGNEKIIAQLDEIRNYKELLENECHYLREELEVENLSNDIIGKSSEMSYIFELISQVAPYESTVLILGETGTGKELVAKAIHQNSPRKDNLMVKVNCATLPQHLIESELFGHERGSFTGATDRRIGKFELANGGTLFLDEIGEMPLDLQAKLLRVLQEKEIERIGGKHTIPVNVRIIAATNRELLQEVSAGRFRSDLYYRLNIFPITLPPLRQRRADIPLLATHFIQKFIKKTGKKVNSLNSQSMQQLIQYSWPGNIRELEHLIERSVLLAKGNEINNICLPTDEHSTLLDLPGRNREKTIEENERDHIIKVLKICQGRIGGPNGAAATLGVPPTTLSSKIKRLGIKRGFNL